MCLRRVSSSWFLLDIRRVAQIVKVCLTHSNIISLVFYYDVFIISLFHPSISSLFPYFFIISLLCLYYFFIISLLNLYFFTISLFILYFFLYHFFISLFFKGFGSSSAVGSGHRSARQTVEYRIQTQIIYSRRNYKCILYIHVYIIQNDYVYFSACRRKCFQYIQFKRQCQRWRWRTLFWR